MQKYSKYFITFFIILVVGILISLNFRYQLNEIGVYEGGHKCLIRTDLLTGKSCLIGGSVVCTGSLASVIDNLDRC